ncbi:MAG TPA: Vi polysaccharide biosynthesis UDP-N-acetylglucosamine C-6 dehydrogenase TviB [Methylocystis sp.]|nr:Vi polysaccharide biosynthesis UDP-N-acetylglucosamine C-6 dehydrogenase TviB [Methylocystis sp.]
MILSAAGFGGGIRLAVIGLGYVGLPLAVAFAKKRPVVGFDVCPARIAALLAGRDRTLEVDDAELQSAEGLRLTSDPADMRDCNVFIVTVPTPVDEHKRPNLSHVVEASQTIGRVLKRGDLVIYESTVYPGATEEECAPTLARESGLVFNRDFFVGYSPERVNPGDKAHRLTAVKKVTAGSTPDAATRVDELYREIIAAGTHKVSSIKVAEAAKVIENTQRDLNIALMNELAIIFNRLGLDTEEVLLAAGTKWNFLALRPGLVGGHCIGVDPYYLTYKAMALGYHPEIILAGRRLNDNMGAYVAGQLIKAMIKRRLHVEGMRVLVMGLTFKENCPDIRNSKVVDIIRELASINARIDVYDPWANGEDAKREYDLTLVAEPEPQAYDAIVIAVAHDAFRQMGAACIRSFGAREHVLYDLKYVLPAEASDLRL